MKNIILRKHKVGIWLHHLEEKTYIRGVFRTHRVHTGHEKPEKPEKQVTFVKSHGKSHENFKKLTKVMKKWS